MIPEKDCPLTDFTPIKVCKQASDSRVDLVKHKPSGNKYILKTFDKEKVMTNGSRIDQVLNESNILKLIAGIPQTGPFAEKMTPEEAAFKWPVSLNRLVTTTKDDNSLCLVLEQAQGIDLITFIKLLDPKLKWESNSMVYKHSEDLVEFLRHIVIQIVIAFEALHKAGIVYKDLKATHIFIDKQLRITMIDFGLAEQMSDGSTSTPAGTMHAMSPEMLILYTKVANG